MADWFDQNAQQANKDWFDQNTPAVVAEPPQATTTQKIISGVNEAVGTLQKGQQMALNPVGMLTEKFIPEGVNQFLKKGLVSPEAMKPITEASMLPIRGLSQVLFGKEASREPLQTTERALSELTSSQTSPENIGLIAGTAGLGAAESILAKRAPNLGEILFGTKASSEALPQIPETPISDAVETKPIGGIDAVQEQSTSSVLQHPQETVTETGGQRERVEPSIQGQETPQASTQEVVPTVSQPEQPIETGARPAQTAITAAAIRTPDGKILTGPSHPDIESRHPSTGGEYGFVDSSGKFLNRERALEVATKSRQITEETRAVLAEKAYDEPGLHAADVDQFAPESKYSVATEPTTPKGSREEIGTRPAQNLQSKFIGKPDTFWGIEDAEDGARFKESGHSAVECTGYSCAIQEKLGADRVKVFGFFKKDNPNSEIGRKAGGHDFAVVDGKYIVDPWITDVEGMSSKGVFDLKSDAAEIQRLYGDPKTWEEVLSDAGSKPVSPVSEPTETATAQPLTKNLGIETPPTISETTPKVQAQPVVQPEKVQSGEFQKQGYTAVSTEEGAKPPVQVTDTQPHVSKIANRFIDERVSSGELGEVAPGSGYSTRELAQRGLRMSPEEINQHISDLVNKTGDPIKQGMAVRAEEARLSQRSAELSRIAGENPKDLEAKVAADNAFKDVTDFHNGPVAQLKQNFHAQGMALQGDIPVDLSTFNGLREKWLKDTGEVPPQHMENTMRKTAQDVRDAVEAENGANQRLSQDIDRAVSRRKLPTVDEVSKNIQDRMKVEPCIT